MPSSNTYRTDASEDALNHVQQVVDEAVDAVEKSVSQAKDRVGETLAQAKGKALAARDQLEAGAAVAARFASTSVESALESSKTSLNETAERTRSWWSGSKVALTRWIDTSPADQRVAIADDKVDFIRTLPFIGVHLMCLGVFFVGFSPVALGVAVFMYLIRMFAVTGFYHRYFSHKSFKTSRVFQFIMGIWGASCVQRGPLWWAANHRHHHKTSDQPEDFHSPVQHGFWWSHMGWIMGKSAFGTNEKQIPDLMKFPELKWLDRFDLVMPVLLGALMLGLGMFLEAYAPSLGTNGPQMLIWGFFVSTVVLFHGTVTINSLSHVWGSRRYQTKDQSRNNWFLAIITLGEGWHNNHHHYPGSARQGFFWYEYDLTYYGLKVLSWFGLIWDLKPVPELFKNAHLKPKA